MARFLDERRGFCQHFAATMAMMARTLDIPSRVAVGFLQPDRKQRRSVDHHLRERPRVAGALLRGCRLGPVRARRPASALHSPAYARRATPTHDQRAVPTSTASVGDAPRTGRSGPPIRPTAGAGADGSGSGSGLGSCHRSAGWCSPSADRWPSPRPPCARRYAAADCGDPIEPARSGRSGLARATRPHPRPATALDRFDDPPRRASALSRRCSTTTPRVWPR